MPQSKVNMSLIKQAIMSKMSASRQGTSATKTRGQVKGGGRKPWKQKGTGRARAGSTRSPIWVGGGTVFGPSTEKNYTLKLSKKMADRAFKDLISYLKSENKIIAVDSLALKEPRTKKALEILKQNNLPDQGVLIVTEDLQPELVLATNNLQGVTVVNRKGLSILDLARATMIAMEKAVYAEFFGPEKPVKKPTIKKAKTEVKEK